MKEALKALWSWLDADFWQHGAFLTSADGQTITLGKGGTFLRVDDLLQEGSPIFYLKDFYQNSYLAYVPAATMTCSKVELQQLLLNMVIEKPLSYQKIDNDDEIYKHDFQNLKSAFGPELEKVVLLSREYYQGFSGERSILDFMKKAFSFGTGLPYGLWNQQYGVIGSTPELLYDADVEKLTTYALAGTAKVGEEAELLSSQKDRHEHDVVVHDIAEKLKPFMQELSIGETKIHPYKNIIHLKTDIVGRVDKEINFTKLTNSMSPTAALGGYPKERSLLFLQKSNYGQKYPMRFFGSAFGIVAKNVKQFVVSIRNVQWNGETLYIESGGGVVAESQLDKEMAEIHLKRETIRKHYL